MSLLSRSISGWFGYSRRERRASLILLVIILFVVAVRFFMLPGKKTPVRTEPFEIQIYPPLMKKAIAGSDSLRLCIFDPNNAETDELRHLGLSSSQVKALVNYRKSGGRIRHPDDIRRIYGIDSTFASRLIPFIVIKTKDTLHPLAERRYFKPRPLRKKIDLNRTDSLELDSLPGIGMVLASRIVKYGKNLGGYVSVYQLREVWGINDTLFLNIRDRLLADTAEVKRININKASFRDIIRHPYFSRRDVQSILKFRSLEGKIDSMEELTVNKVISTETASKIRPYIRF